MKILHICVEGSSRELGTGHVVRGRYLLDELAKVNYHELTVLTNSNSFEELKGLRKYVLNNLKEIKKKIEDFYFLSQFEIIIFDTLDIFADSYEIIKKQEKIIVGIDVSENLSMVDIRVNPSINSKNVFLKGLHYSIINPILQNFKSIERENLFVCFGGYDHKKHLQKIIGKLEKIKSFKAIFIVTSSKEEYDQISNLDLKKTRVFYKPNNFYSILNSSSVALISGGVLLQEAAHLGVPSMVIPQYKHQKMIGKRLLKEDACLEVKNINLNYETLINDVVRCSHQEKRLENISSSSASLNDGFGSKRLINILKLYEHLDWDSSFFGFHIGQITSKYLNKSIFDKVLSFEQYQNDKLIYFLAQSTDSDTINFANQNDFNEVDRRITFSLKKSDFMANRKFLKGLRIDICTEKDINEIGDLAQRTNWQTRYFNDPVFPKTKLKEFYKLWGEKSVRGNLDNLVIAARLDGDLAGFISLKFNGKNSSSIGLITVDSQYQGLKIGDYLIDFAARYLFKRDFKSVDVVTQFDNGAAKNLYYRNNFKVTNDQLWFHKWQ
jgi:spore coat polysaccharide biosynthesis predicted glycosyltransferase SpsG/ribosomal protein S18 acetylase RimI-like enzyme